jgi:chemotaxis protein CheX
MRMELIQPFINAADAVFSEMLQSPTKINDLSMDEETYRREGRVVLDIAPEVAYKIASHLTGGTVQEGEQIARETVCELANMVIGNSVTLLNDQGFRFKVFPPEIHTTEEGLAGGADTEAMVICIDTPCGEVFLNIAMHYMRRRRKERDAVAVD